MNEMTLFIAQLSGPTLLILGLGMLMSPQYYADLMKELKSQKFVMMLAVMIMIPVGTLMVMKHNLWGSLSEILVSILGWALVIKGALMALVPTFFFALIDSYVKPGLLRFGALVWLLGGGYLTWMAFFV